MNLQKTPTVYETNHEYLIRLGKSENGYDYLCVGKNYDYGYSQKYSVGDVVSDLEDYYVEESKHFKIQDSDLYGTFLFNYFLSNYNTK